MDIIADLQIHSKYARATSTALSLQKLEEYARIKGLDLLGTGDFQHPLHRKEIDNYLKEDKNGVLWSDTKFPFIWQTEVSLMFSQGGKRRAVHLLLFAPNTKIADAITSYLGSKGRLDYDGRPIFGITCKQLVADLKKIDDLIEIIPAHCLLPSEKIICNPGVKNISVISNGDKVLTHTGEFKPVSNVLSRQYKGKILRLQPYYFAEGIQTTPEHPLFSIKTTKNCQYVGGLCKPNSIAKGKHKCKKKHYENYKPGWTLAENLEVNDVLVYPKIKQEKDLEVIRLSEVIEMGEYRLKDNKVLPISGRQDRPISNIIQITPEFCRLVGYYLAEGYIVRKNNCIQFAFAEHESDYISEVVQLMKSVFGIEISKIRKNHGYELYFYSKVVAELFSILFYERGDIFRANTKLIPQWMLYLPKVKQVELFRGWWRGDAGVTVSETLAQQMKAICLRIGVIPSIYIVKKETSKKYKRSIGGRKIIVNHDCFTFRTLAFFKDEFNLMTQPEFKRFNTKLSRRHGWIDDNYVYLPIKTIEYSDYEGKVYDLQIEGSHSFVTPSAAVHNCMTPWFGLFGSGSGFDSIKECFEEQTKHIHAVESGMSADPGMIWRMDQGVNVVSFSDAHSFWPWRLGREATIFDVQELSYTAIMNAIRTGVGLKATIETPPEYGKYHFDGHRVCGFSCSPAETRKLNGICPICKKPLTIGVEYRIEELAKQPEGYKPKNAKPYYKLIPLHEMLAFNMGTSMASKKVAAAYEPLVKKFGNELNILLNVSKQQLLDAEIDAGLVNLILLSREGRLPVKPGFDGEYGVIEIGGGKKKLKEPKAQKSISDFS